MEFSERTTTTIVPDKINNLEQSLSMLGFTSQDVVTEIPECQDCHARIWIDPNGVTVGVVVSINGVYVRFDPEAQPIIADDAS